MRDRCHLPWILTAENCAHIPVASTRHSYRMAAWAGDALRWVQAKRKGRGPLAVSKKSKDGMFKHTVPIITKGGASPAARPASLWPSKASLFLASL